MISLLTMTAPEVKWTGSQVDRKSSSSGQGGKSSGPEVKWTGSQVDRKSIGQCGPEVTSSGPEVKEVTWTQVESHVDRKSRGPEVTWTGVHVDRKSRGPDDRRTISHQSPLCR